MDRRGFLNPGHLAEAAGQVLGAADELGLALAPDAPETSDEIPLVRLGWRAMATRFEMLLPLGTPNDLVAGRDGFEFLDTLEDQLTVYRDSSEVAKINRLAFLRPIHVAPRLFDLLLLSQQIHGKTDGAFDVAIGSLIKCWGFFRGPRRVPDRAILAEVLARSGMIHVELDIGRKAIRFQKNGLELNLGSIGKGHALDLVSQRLEARWNIGRLLLHGGSSSVLARGDAHGDGRGWAIRIRHPFRQKEALAEVRLHDQALGTSAATFQHFFHQGKRLGHILDPRDGWPASGIASASVIAPQAALADALSTAFYVGGMELAKRYCESHPDVGAILLSEGASVATVFGIPSGSYTLFNSPS